MEDAGVTGACYCDNDQATCEGLKHPVCLQESTVAGYSETFYAEAAAPVDHCVIEEPAKVFDHIMIDIETMSLSKHNALLLSIGMLEFDPVPREGVVIGKSQLIIPSLEQQLALGREVSKTTQKWWRDQPQAASDHWRNYYGERRPLGSVCGDIRRFVNGRRNVWANGVQFDLVNLETLAEQIGETEELWHYQAPSDMRSFVRHTPQTRITPIGDAIDLTASGVPHHPVYDCTVQAHRVWQHWDHCQS